MIEVSPEEFEARKYRRFGHRNPEVMNCAFWDYMVRSGITAWEASRRFAKSRNELEEAVWCYDRFGIGKTSLPDGRAVTIGGEHEDFYDDDFCIYNDVIVFDSPTRFTIYGYPKEIFPPTDFHSATLVGNAIYIIGGLGYRGERVFDETPIYRLDTATFAIDQVATCGDKPGWIHNHEAVYLAHEHAIYLGGGLLSRQREGKEILTAGTEDYVLDLTSLEWRRVDGKQSKPLGAP